MRPHSQYSAWTPLAITQLLHYNTTAEPFTCVDMANVEENVDDFLEWDLIEAAPHGWTTTPKGHAICKAICVLIGGLAQDIFWAAVNYPENRRFRHEEIGNT